MPFVLRKVALWMNARTNHVTIFTNNLLNHCITMSISNTVLKYYGTFHSFVHPQLYETIKDGCLVQEQSLFFQLPNTSSLKTTICQIFGVEAAFSTLIFSVKPEEEQMKIIQSRTLASCPELLDKRA